METEASEGRGMGRRRQERRRGGGGCLVLVLLMLDCAARRDVSRVNVSKISTYLVRLIRECCKMLHSR